MKTNCGLVGCTPARWMIGLVLAGSIAVTVDAQAPATAPTNSTPTPTDDSQAPRHRQGHGQGQGRGDGGGRGWGTGIGGGRGTVGTVTEVAADHYVIKTDAGELYTVHFSVNTRIMKQPAGMGFGPGQGGGTGSGAGGGNGERADRANREQGGDRPQPQPLKPSEIKVGDAVTVGGELDVPNKSLGALFILQLDPERVKELRAEEAKFGKTWLAGRITAIAGTTITIEGMLDHVPHAIAVDENTSFRQRRDAITLADIKAGDQLRAEGGMKDGVFLATVVNAMNRTGGDMPGGTGPGGTGAGGTGPGGIGPSGSGPAGTGPSGSGGPPSPPMPQ